jgi:hypothetical protein
MEQQDQPVGSEPTPSPSSKMRLVAVAATAIALIAIAIPFVWQPHVDAQPQAWPSR